MSCQTSQNPVGEYGRTHWIQYDLGQSLPLSTTRIWNINDPDQLDIGFNTVQVDYSENGEEWQHWGSMRFPRANGEAIYGGFQGPDLQGIEARYVVFTVIDTHGDGDCAGLTEVKFNLRPQDRNLEEDDEIEIEPEEMNDWVEVYPNPTEDVFHVFLEEYEGPLNVTILTLNGQIIYSDEFEVEDYEWEQEFSTRSLRPGIYFLLLQGEDFQGSKRLVVRR